MKCAVAYLLVNLVGFWSCVNINAQPGEFESRTIEPRGIDAIRRIVEYGIRSGNMPGCVIAIGTSDQTVFLEAFGNRQLQPDAEPMTRDTLFDLASLTKPIATATSVFKLYEQGRIQLNMPVREYCSAFAGNGKQDITVMQLLQHYSGLTADNALADYQDGFDSAIKRIENLPVKSEPGTQFRYSDVGFMVLAELVRRITDQNIHEFSRDKIFEPLEMLDTGFVPPESLRARAAPADKRSGTWIKGVVHDPRSYALDGIAGHAGLFSTAADLSLYAQMLLGQGTTNGVQILRPETVKLMTSPHQLSLGRRSPGWDVRSPYSSNRGDLFSDRAFGHGGFTGTAIWIDPELDLFVVFLSNRLHPDGKGSVNSLVGRICTVAAATISPAPALSDVMTGIDVLQADDCKLLHGKRIGLITNQTGVDRRGFPTWKILHEHPSVDLRALFSPEHGFLGTLEQSDIADAEHSESGLPIHSLYGESRQPTAESLRDLDVLVFDIQDIGTRFYTYASTLALAMQAAELHGVEMVVLDRPNPINGVVVSGPVLDAGAESFTGMLSGIPVRHGLTMGEWASLYRSHTGLDDLNLTVVEMQGWQRSMYFDETGLPWINPSPNIRSLEQAIHYPGLGLLEMTNLSVGRGTDRPFEIMGAPWIDGEQLAKAMNDVGLAGIRFEPVSFTPQASKYAGKTCQGLRLMMTNRLEYAPVDTGLQLMITLGELYPTAWNTARLNTLLRNEITAEQILAGEDLASLKAAFQKDLEKYQTLRKDYLKY